MFLLFSKKSLFSLDLDMKLFSTALTKRRGIKQKREENLNTGPKTTSGRLYVTVLSVQPLGGIKY
jgi:hypothetical protein